MTVLIILAVLLVSLVIIVPLIERSSFRMSPQKMSSLSRWILPLAVILAAAQLIRYLLA